MTKGCFEKLGKLLRKIEVYDSQDRHIPLNAAIKRIIGLINLGSKAGSKIIFIGNGGSASIASHMAADFLKNAGVPAVAFNDSSLLTCLGNDLGFEYVFEKPLSMLAQKGDILFAISSSGQSKNILNAVLKAKEKGCLVVALSGFSGENPLRKLGAINFYVPSDSYGDVEISHLAVCHCIVDELVKQQ